MRTAALGLCLFGFCLSALPSPALASIEYRAKTDEAALFRTEALEPPPLAALEKGQGLKLIHRGAARSLVETEGGIKGWMRNQDILGLASGAGQAMRFGDQAITGSGDLNVSPLVLLAPEPVSEVMAPDRSFLKELPEAIDREQVEIKNGDN